jgi:thiamine biosynthesis lipoprotein
MLLHQLAFRAMASPCTLQLWCADATEAANALQAAADEVRRIEAKYSRYRADSVMGAINAQAGGAPVAIDAETEALLDFAEHCFRDSDGLFDITSGVLRRVWRFDQPCLTTQNDIEQLLPLIGWRRVQRAPGIVSLPERGMELDFGGFGKEYAADRAAAVLHERGHTHALVNLGGDVRAAGPQADGSPWRVGVRHPREPNALIAYLDVHHGALATSGDYERHVVVDGVRYSHVLDPRSGWPVRCAQSLSVQAPLCIVAGAHATIALLRGDDAQIYLDATDLPYFLVDRQGVRHARATTNS